LEFWNAGSDCCDLMVCCILQQEYK
jgi:hypothetical protein